MVEAEKESRVISSISRDGLSRQLFFKDDEIVSFLTAIRIVVQQSIEIHMFFDPCLPNPFNVGPVEKYKCFAQS